jgi:hypothetical protein
MTERQQFHKAVGWMLREVGKTHQPTLETVLKRHGRVMPRTPLRYAIERFPDDLRRAYLDASAYLDHPVNEVNLTSPTRQRVNS